MSDLDIFQANDGNFVEFYTKEIKNEHESAKEGRPIYVSQHWVKIISPGDRLTIPEFQMDEIRIERYREQYETWRRRVETGETGLIGTPLAAWPTIDRAMAAGLKDLGILSVEMLAGIQDTNLHRFGPGIRTLRNQARAYLEAAKGNAPLTKLAAENEGLRNQVETMQRQLEEVTALVKEKAPAQAAASAPAADTVQLQAQVAQLAQLVSTLTAQPPAAAPQNGRAKGKGGWPKGRKRKGRAVEASAAA